MIGMGRMKAALPTVGKFLLRMVLFSMLFSAADSSQFVIGPWQDATLYIVVFLMEALSFPVSVNGSYVATSINGEVFGFFIDWDCTGWKSMFFFLSLVLSVARERKEVLKSFIFLPVLYILNISRIIGVLLALKVYGVGAFDAIHGIAFGSLSAVYTLAAWVVWMRMVGNGSRL